MSIIKEFKAFAMRGNVVDMAVGIILGVAFGKIVSSLVSDVLLPPIGLLMGGVDFSHFAITLKQATEASAAVTLKYGIFINTVIDFIIVAFSVFLVIKGMNKLKKAEVPPAPEAPKLSKEAELLTDIRELLRKS
ncbi:MAG: large-conductance mechanosensitive channel protein MscL [Bacteroidota bacterium]|nr:large-conductance mechanosensitive channel protein MscL [Bacteroidota bacterium]